MHTLRRTHAASGVLGRRRHGRRGGQRQCQQQRTYTLESQDVLHVFPLS
jgi:hypothetical protein